MPIIGPSILRVLVDPEPIGGQIQGMGTPPSTPEPRTDATCLPCSRQLPPHIVSRA